MQLNIDPRIRASLYLFATLGTPVIAYLFIKGIIGEAEVGLWAALNSAITAMAALKTSNTN